LTGRYARHGWLQGLVPLRAGKGCRHGRTFIFPQKKDFLDNLYVLFYYINMKKSKKPIRGRPSRGRGLSLTVYLSRELAEAIKRAAKQSQSTLQEEIRITLRQKYVKRMEP
jgi:hypothetical protein